MTELSLHRVIYPWPPAPSDPACVAPAPAADVPFRHSSSLCERRKAVGPVPTPRPLSPGPMHGGQAPTSFEALYEAFPGR